jgi:hypothetical protein
MEAVEAPEPLMRGAVPAEQEAILVVMLRVEVTAPVPETVAFPAE